MVVICYYDTYIRHIKFIHGNVISSEYTVNEYVHIVPKQNLKTIQWYLLNPLKPNDPYRGRTAPLTSKVAFYIFIQQI